MLTPAQLAARCGKLGGSDIASLFGCGFLSLNQLWHRKRAEFLTGTVEPTPTSWRMDRGSKLESLILDYVESELGVIVRDVPFIAHPTIPWLVGNLDGVVIEDGVRIPIDAKSVSSFQRHAWEDDKVPEKYRLQMHAYMMLTDAPHSYLTAAIGDDDPIVTKVDRDEALVEEIIRLGNEFMLSIELGEEMGKGADRATEKADRSKEMECDPALAELVDRWKKAKLIETSAKAEAKEAAEMLMLHVDSSTRLLLRDGLKVLRIDQRLNSSLDTDMLERDHPGLLDRYRKVGSVSTFPVIVKEKKK